MLEFFVCCGVRYGKEGDGGTVFFFNRKTMIDLCKIFSGYVTGKGINEYTDGNTWVVGDQRQGWPCKQWGLDRSV